MMPIINQIDTKESSFTDSFNAYLLARNKVSAKVSKLVAEIILKVRSNGDQALKELTKEFDGFDSDIFKISSKEINHLLKSCDKDVLKSLEYSFGFLRISNAILSADRFPIPDNCEILYTKFSRSLDGNSIKLI